MVNAPLIDISGIDRRVLFQKLFNESAIIPYHPQCSNEPLTDADFQELEEMNWMVEFSFRNRLMSINLSSDTLNPKLYDKKSRKPAFVIVGLIRDPELLTKMSSRNLIFKAGCSFPINIA